jgi:hypothetical protein
MSRQRKTRTKSTDSVPARHSRKLQQVRREVAAEAARIIATQGQGNYHAAKKKAAERIGVSQRLALPSNLEVHDALLRYQALYGGEQHEQNLLHLRLAAQEAMQNLSDFSPRLVGSVLDGTAGKHSRISLHVFGDEPEDLVLYFLEKEVSFIQEQRQIRWHDSGHRLIPVLVVELKGSKVELAIFSHVDVRQSPPSPIDGKPQQRAALYELQCQIEPATRGVENFS